MVHPAAGDRRVMPGRHLQPIVGVSAASERAGEVTKRSRVYQLKIRGVASDLVRAPSDRPCRAYSRRRRCAAPGPALPAPGSALARPARRPRAVPSGQLPQIRQAYSASGVANVARHPLVQQLLRPIHIPTKALVTGSAPNRGQGLRRRTNATRRVFGARRACLRLAHARARCRFRSVWYRRMNRAWTWVPCRRRGTARRSAARRLDYPLPKASAIRTSRSFLTSASGRGSSTGKCSDPLVEVYAAVSSASWGMHRPAVRQVAEVVLEGREPRDGLASQLERGHPVGDALLRLRDDGHDGVPQGCQRGPLRFVEGGEVLVDRVGRRHLTRSSIRYHRRAPPTATCAGLPALLPILCCTRRRHDRAVGGMLHAARFPGHAASHLPRHFGNLRIPGTIMAWPAVTR